MFVSRIDLHQDTRQHAANSLQPVLVGLLELRFLLKQAHWTVRGTHFYQLHTLFDDLVAPVDAQTDDVAERIAALGINPDGRLQTVASEGALQEPATLTSDATAHIRSLAEAYARLGRMTRKAVQVAETLEDPATADLLTGVLRALDKGLWFLEAHISVE